MQDNHEKMVAAYQILGQDILSVGMFENICTILKGIHPDVDKRLNTCSKAFSTLQKIQSGDILTLAAENLSEDTEKEKRKKKALLFFIQTSKDLQSEIKRLDTEFQNSQKQQNQFMNWGRIIKYAKGPFGLTTLAALLIIGISAQFIHLTHKPLVSTTQKGKQVAVILYKNKQLPLSQLYVGHGPDCDSPHYHATTGVVTALDGTVIPDPEGCGFGKVKDTQVLTISQ